VAALTGALLIAALLVAALLIAALLIAAIHAVIAIPGIPDAKFFTLLN
jgi:hypothetical protein